MHVMYSRVEHVLCPQLVNELRLTTSRFVLQWMIEICNSADAATRRGKHALHGKSSRP